MRRYFKMTYQYESFQTVSYAKFRKMLKTPILFLANLTNERGVPIQRHTAGFPFRCLRGWLCNSQVQGATDSFDDFKSKCSSNGAVKQTFHHITRNKGAVDNNDESSVELQPEPGTLKWNPAFINASHVLQGSPRPPRERSLPGTAQQQVLVHIVPPV